MSEHKHSHGCCCGSHANHHSEDKHCAGNSNQHNCGCHSHENQSEMVSFEDLTETETHFLKHLIDYEFLPVARFIVKSTKEEDFENIVLSPVFIIDTKDTIEQVKNVAKKLTNLENGGFITIDYDIPLNGYSYSEYHNSSVFKYFKETVLQASCKKSFLGDTAVMECGSIAPTDKAMKI